MNLDISKEDTTLLKQLKGMGKGWPQSHWLMTSQSKMVDL